jgi:hypothetical protein
LLRRRAKSPAETAPERHAELPGKGQIAFPRNGVGILSGDERFGAGQLQKIPRAADVIDVPMGVKDVFDLARREAKPVNSVQQQIQRLRVTGVEKDQSATGIDQMRRRKFCADKVKIAQNTEWFHTGFPDRLNHAFLPPEKD